MRSRHGRILGRHKSEDSERILNSVLLFSGNFEEVVAIGGIAVFLHCVAAERVDLATEFTKDADFMVSIAAFGQLRDAMEVTDNRKLQKHQVVIEQVEFDIYRARSHGLRLDFDDLAVHSSVVHGVRIAHKQHLILLKLTALADRGASSHGKKDARDIAKLLILSANDRLIIGGYLTDQDLKLLDRVMSDESVLRLAGGNAHLASRLRREAAQFIAKIDRSLKRR